MRTKLVAVALVLCSASALQASTNLLLNPGFDTDLSSWSVGTTGAVASLVFTNLNPAPYSRAVKLLQPSAIGPGTSTLSQCVQVTPGKAYSATVRYFNTQSTLDPEGAVHILLQWSTDSSCGGSLGYEDVADHPLHYFTEYSIQANRVAPASAHSVRVHLGVSKPAGHADYSAVFDDAFFGEGYCANDQASLCLANRFRVTATWKSANGHQGTGYTAKLRESTGAFFFFDPENLELMVKVVNGCAVNNRFWVFAGGLTNVQTLLTVTDKKTGAVKTYLNPQGKAFQPIQDTAAFATCP